jgi:sugar-specific transcriptional regulator TrmB
LILRFSVERLTLQHNHQLYILPISIEKEKKALQWLTQTLQCALDKFNTSLEKDSQQLQQQGLNSRLRTAIIYRYGRMKILDKYIQYIDSARKFLECESLEREQIISAAPSDLQRYMRQLTTISEEKNL